jgi:diacylglycerol kinase (ATP)
VAEIRALLLFNPRAGRAFPSLSEDAVVRRLQAAGIECEPWVLTAGPDESLPVKGRELVVVCGGDGTIHRALPHLAGSGIPLGLIPAGTANVLARELGIPRDPDAAVEIIARGRVRSICLGSADGRLFHLMGGAGLDGYLLDKVGTRLKRVLGVGAFWLAGFWSFWGYRFEEIEVQIEDEVQVGTFVVVSNCRLYGGTLPLTPRASLFEAGLDVCLFRSASHFRYARYLLAGVSGRHLELPDVVYRKARRVLVRSRRPVKVQLDGEPAGFLPVEFRSAEEALRVVVPDSPP